MGADKGESRGPTGRDSGGGGFTWSAWVKLNVGVWQTNASLLLRVHGVTQEMVLELGGHSRGRFHRRPHSEAHTYLAQATNCMALRTSASFVIIAGTNLLVERFLRTYRKCQPWWSITLRTTIMIGGMIGGNHA